MHYDTYRLNFVGGILDGQVRYYTLPQLGDAGADIVVRTMRRTVWYNSLYKSTGIMVGDKELEYEHYDCVVDEVPVLPPHYFERD